MLSEESLAIIDTAVSTSEPNQQTTNQGNASEATATGQEIDIKAPVFPESVADGTISEWHKKEGEAVSEGDILAEIETDKVVLEVPATSNGVLTKY